ERARLRAALDAAGWRPCSIADRQRLETAALADPVVARLTALAGRVVGAELRALGVRWLRLRHGDYQLTKADALERPAGAHVEVIADLSAAATGEAEIFYSDGRIVAQRPGAVSVVERDASLLRWQRYLTLRVGDAAVYRLVVTLARYIPVQTPPQ
ncbi:MAG TPA: hypothetical protein VF997_19820, partial [Polyangia bacterium]